MSTLLQTATLLLTVLGAAHLTRGSPLGPINARQQEAFHLHHRAALRGLAAVKKANEIRAAASARKAVYVPAAASITPVVAPAPAPAPTAAPVVTSTAAPTRAPIPLSAMPVPEIWRQFVLDRLTAAIGSHHRTSSQAASLPDVTLSQKALTRLLAEAKSHDPQQTSSAWHRSAALQLRAAMDADQKLALAEKRPGGQEPTLAMAKAIGELSTTKSQPVPADTVVPPLTKSELRYIRELLEEALEGDVILPQ